MKDVEKLGNCLAFDGWPDERKDLHNAAANGLLDGDLAPLLAYIRSGFAVDSDIMAMLALAIEGHSPFKLKLHGARKGQKPMTDIAARYNRDLEIGAFMERKLQGGAGEFEAAVADARTQWGVSRTVVTAALASLRRQLQGQDTGQYQDFVKLGQLRAEFAHLGPA